MVNARRFLEMLVAAAGPLAAGRATALYRRAVPTEARAGLAAPSLPVPGLAIAPSGVAVLDPAGFTDGALGREAVDAALHAARAAGATWAVAWVVAPEDVAVLRALEFLPLGVSADP